MTETVKNIPLGVRPNMPKRPAMDGEAWEKVRKAQEKMRDREYVRFSAFKVDPAWRRLPVKERGDHKTEFEELIATHGRDMIAE